MISTELGRLKTLLLKAGLQRSNNALYQTLNNLIDLLLRFEKDVQASPSRASVTESSVREAGYWTPLVRVNGPGSVEFVVTDGGRPIAVWTAG